MTSRPVREPWLASKVTWAVLAASFGLSAATWIAIAELAGWTGTIQILWFQFHLAWLMPVCVDGYVVVSLVTWLAPVSDEVARFARRNTYGAAGIGVLAQAAYHGLTIWSATGVIWRVTLAAVAGMLPPGISALSVHMRALIRRAALARETAADVPTPADVPVPAVSVAVVERVDPLGLDGRDAPEPEPEPAGTPEPVVESVPAPAKPKPRRVWSEQQILKALSDPVLVPRGPDGKVSVEYVQKTFNRGQDKAVELLQKAGLHRSRDGERVPVDTDVDVPDPRGAPVNYRDREGVWRTGHPTPEEIGPLAAEEKEAVPA